MIEDLNQNSDLTVKLNNQSKICKILQQSADIIIGNSELIGGSENETEDPKIIAEKIKIMLEECKASLEKLQQEKESAIEDFLEELSG